MTKSKKVVSKKSQAEAPVEVAPAPMPIAADAATAAEAPAPAQVPAPSKPVRARQENVPADPATEARARWARRLRRWQAKAQAAGVDARALMTEALAG